MKRDEVSGLLARVLAEALSSAEGADGDQTAVTDKSSVRVELSGVSLRVRRIALVFEGRGSGEQ